MGCTDLEFILIPVEIPYQTSQCSLLSCGSLPSVLHFVVRKMFFASEVIEPKWRGKTHIHETKLEKFPRTLHRIV